MATSSSQFAKSGRKNWMNLIKKLFGQIGRICKIIKGNHSRLLYSLVFNQLYSIPFPNYNLTIKCIYEIHVVIFPHYKKTILQNTELLHYLRFANHNFSIHTLLDLQKGGNHILMNNQPQINTQRETCWFFPTCLRHFLHQLTA